MKTTVVIPAKNEEKSIATIIEQCLPVADEVLLVDGHSEDRTREIADGLGVRCVLDNKKGKGDAIRVGLAEAKGDVVVFIDADMSHDPREIPRLVEPIVKDGMDMVIGSRTRGGSDELFGDWDKLIRVIGSHIITMSINYRYKVALTDSQNGFRAIRRTAGLDIGMEEDIFTIEQEMIMKLLKRGYKVTEVPSHEYARRYGESNIVVWKVAPRYLFSLIKGLI